jgi:hypothetical protein
MKKNPIGIDRQLDFLTDTLNTDELETNKKVKFLTDNIDKLERVNGSLVYYAKVKDKDVYYFLSTAGVQYYYPIKYATLEFTTL